MATKLTRKTPAVLAALRTLAESEQGASRKAALRMVAELEKRNLQVFENEAHARLACTKCLRLPCRCGAPKPPSLDDVLKVQQERRH